MATAWGAVRSWRVIQRSAAIIFNRLQRKSFQFSTSLTANREKKLSGRALPATLLIPRNAKDASQN